MSEDATPGSFPWELEPPLHTATGFMMAGGAVEVRFAYAVCTKAVLLIAALKMGNIESAIWRRHWTSYEGAVDAAEILVGDAEEYLEGVLQVSLRPTEDLDADDFVRHLYLRLNNGFN